MIDLSGTHLAVPTPFVGSTQRVDVPGFARNLGCWFAEPIAGVLVAGSTGESVFLEARERDDLVRAARAAAGTDGIVIAGAGAESTRSAITAVRSVAEAGADVALVSPPAFYRGAMNERALFAHYRAIADASPVPVLVYQVPLRLGTIELPTSLVAALSDLEGIVGIKDSRGDLGKTKELIGACSGEFQVLVGSGAILLDALKAGAVGGIVAAGVLCAGQAALVSTAFTDGREEEASRAQSIVSVLHDGVVTGLGVPGVKAALGMLGLIGGEPRRPLAPLSDGDRVKLEHLLGAVLAPRTLQTAGSRSRSGPSRAQADQIMARTSHR